MELTLTETVLYGIVFGIAWGISSKIYEEIHNYIDKKRKIKKLENMKIKFEE